MFEKVNPKHPDKVADRIAGAIVDLAYTKETDPKVAVEVLIGHGLCTIIVESSVKIEDVEARSIVERITESSMDVKVVSVPQDKHLAGNQQTKVRCGDNGIFKGVPVTLEENSLATLARGLYEAFPFDGKYVYDIESGKLIICQSNVREQEMRDTFQTSLKDAIINPLGFWTGGTDVDSGATNRKLGSDMAQSVTGGGLHGKDLSKADVSVNIYAFLKAQQTGEPVQLFCAIGDEFIDGKPYEEIVNIARQYINGLGGFEKFAEWGLV